MLVTPMFDGSADPIVTVTPGATSVVGCRAAFPSLVSTDLTRAVAFGFSALISRATADPSRRLRPPLIPLKPTRTFPEVLDR